MFIIDYALPIPLMRMKNTVRWPAQAPNPLDVKHAALAGFSMALKNENEGDLPAQNERVRLFPSPVLTGSGSEGIISARMNEHP
jgi:hypothetical protein